MGKLIGDLCPVYAIGLGWRRYHYLSETSYVELGLKSIRDALADARIMWSQVQSSFVAHARLGVAVGRTMPRHLGAFDHPLVHVENASASGSTAFRHDCIELESGISDVALAVGVDAPAARVRASTTMPSLADDAIVPFTQFALLTNQYSAKRSMNPEDIALVAVNNHGNGALNPNVQRQKARTFDEVLGGRPIAGQLADLSARQLAKARPL